MIGLKTNLEAPGTIDSPSPDPVTSRPRLIPLLLISACCGLVAGLLEVGALALRKRTFDPDHFYKLSRHFPWLIPISNLWVFMTLALIGGVLVVAWPRRGPWLFARGLFAMTLLPAFLTA